jgi:hypothetical protein
MDTKCKESADDYRLLLVFYLYFLAFYTIVEESCILYVISVLGAEHYQQYSIFM